MRGNQKINPLHPALSYEPAHRYGVRTRSGSQARRGREILLRTPRISFTKSLGDNKIKKADCGLAFLGKGCDVGRLD
jgi:hypothetical protein